MSTATLAYHLSTRGPRHTLESVADYASMANINPYSPVGVLDQFMEQVERIEVATRWETLAHREAPEIPTTK